MAAASRRGHGYRERKRTSLSVLVIAILVTTHLRQVSDRQLSASIAYCVYDAPADLAGTLQFIIILRRGEREGGKGWYGIRGWGD